MNRNRQAPDVPRYAPWIAALVLAIALGVQLGGGPIFAQKQQESFKDRLHWSHEQAGVAVACSADGQYVYVAGPDGVIASNDFGRTGSWSLVVRGKN